MRKIEGEISNIHVNVKILFTVDYYGEYKFLPDNAECYIPHTNK